MRDRQVTVVSTTDSLNAVRQSVGLDPLPDDQTPAATTIPPRQTTPTGVPSATGSGVSEPPPRGTPNQEKPAGTTTPAAAGTTPPTDEEPPDEDEATDADDQEPQPPRKLSRRERRIEGLLKRVTATEQALQQKDAELAQLRATLDAPPSAAPAATPSDGHPPAAPSILDVGEVPDGFPPEPKEDDFEDYASYWKAETLWLTTLRNAQVILAGQRAAHERAAAEAQQRTAESWRARMETFTQAHPDFDTAATFTTNEAIDAIILQSEVGPLLVKHLVDHPDEATALAQLRGPELFRQMGRLEAKYETTSTPPSAAGPPKAKPPAALPSADALPPPITPLRGATSIPTGLPRQSNFADYKEARLRQMRRS